VWKRKIYYRLMGCPPHPEIGEQQLGWNGYGLYRRSKAMGKGESLWSPIICNHQMEQVNMPG
jgi:hypothetical protein